MKYKDKYYEYGVYNIEDIINDFINIFGKSFITLINNFLSTDKNIISKEEIKNYCTQNFQNLNESKYIDNINDIIINSRFQDYDVLRKIINIYKEKGETLLYILMYLKKTNKRNEQYEELLTQLDINHYKSIICGRDVIRILEALNNIFNSYNKNIRTINDLNTYNRINYDNLAISSGEIYPNRSLINKEGMYDKTSLKLVKKMTK